MVDDSIIVKLKENKEYFCILSKTTPTLDDNNWVKSVNSTCILNYNGHANLYIKNKNKIVYSSDKDLFIDTYNGNIIYVPLNGKYNYFRYIIGNKDKLNIKNYDKKIAYFDDEFNIVAASLGNTDYKFKYKNMTQSGNIIVTNLITERTEYNSKKEYLTCKKYSIEENNTLDKILRNRIESVKYKTRAASVEAARFLALDFPYRIDYFYENGRQTTNKVDGEGRYYHIGLYLNESKYKDLTGSTYTKNKGTWGCSIYDYPAKRNIDNGLDCSGFVSWALLNGGFDVKDVGAGWSNDLDLTDYGKVEKVTSSLIKSDVIKVGDLLHSEKAGGQIGIIVGMDKENYYIAQALWFDEIGVIITKREKTDLASEFPHVVLMDEYYINDGNLTNMW